MLKVALNGCFKRALFLFNENMQKAIEQFASQLPKKAMQQTQKYQKLYSEISDCFIIFLEKILLFG